MDYDQCLKYIKQYVKINYYKDITIDPCAGNGEFINDLTHFNFYYDAVERKQPFITQLDFLKVDFNKFDKTILAGLWYDYVHIVGCPPPELAARFIKKACEFANSVSFILPKAVALQKHFPPNYQLIFSVDLQENERVFQIWQLIM